MAAIAPGGGTNGNTGVLIPSTSHADLPVLVDTHPDRPYQVSLPGSAPFTLTLTAMDELLHEVFAELSQATEKEVS